MVAPNFAKKQILARNSGYIREFGGKKKLYLCCFVPPFLMKL